MDEETTIAGGFERRETPAEPPKDEEEAQR
jgi:hypothetical protein